MFALTRVQRGGGCQLCQLWSRDGLGRRETQRMQRAYACARDDRARRRKRFHGKARSMSGRR